MILMYLLICGRSPFYLFRKSELQDPDLDLDSSTTEFELGNVHALDRDSHENLHRAGRFEPPKWNLLG